MGVDNSERTCIPCSCYFFFFPDGFSGIFYFAIKENHSALSSGLLNYYVCGNTAHEKQERFIPSKPRKDVEDMEKDCVINYGILNNY